MTSPASSSPYVSMQFTRTLRDELRTAKLMYQAQVQQELTFSQVVECALRVAERHMDETFACLRASLPAAPEAD